MNKILLSLLFITNFSFAQVATFSSEMKEGDYSEYVSKNKISIKSDNELLIGFPSNGNKFTYLTQGNDLVDARLNNIYIVIDKIKIIKMQNGFCKAYATFKGFGMIPIYIDIEAAIHFNEIITQ